MLHNVIPLPLSLRKNGFDYTLVKRGKRTYIYAQYVSPTVTRYEVFLIKIKPARTLFGKEVKAREVFPPDKAFGYWAWCCWDLQAAMKRFNELEESEVE